MESAKNESGFTKSSTTGTNDSDPIAAAAIGVYLVIHTMVLAAREFVVSMILGLVAPVVQKK